jgi:tetratricopeptide (TPR) repeat protein
MVYPADLAAFYPIFSKKAFSLEYVLSFLLFGLISAAVVIYRKKRPFLAAAWLYYLVTLAPVLGILQVGSQAAADRYTYLPCLGPLMLLGAAGGVLYSRWRFALLLLAAALAAVLGYGTFKQVGLWKDSIALWENILRVYPRNSAYAYNNLAASYEDAGRLDEAIALYEQTLEAQTTRLGAGDPATRQTLGSLAVAYQMAGRYDKAEPLFRKALAFVRENPNLEQSNLDQLLSNLGSNLLLQKKPDAAEPLFRECLEIHVKLRPDDWPRFRALSQVGASLLGQERYAEAEPLLLEGYNGLSARASKIPANLRTTHLTSAARWLAELYEGWDKKDQAAPWREKWEAHRQGGKAKEPKASDEKSGNQS